MTTYDARGAIIRWRAAEAKRAANDQRYRAMGFLLPVIELADEARNPDGTREFCALLDDPAPRGVGNG